jgi:hypothetical protein
MFALLIRKDTHPFSSSSADITIPTEARLDECQREPDMGVTISSQALEYGT